MSNKKTFEVILYFKGRKSFTIEADSYDDARIQAKVQEENVPLEDYVLDDIDGWEVGPNGEHVRSNNIVIPLMEEAE